MKNEHGRNLINDAAMFLAGMTRFIKNLVCLVRGQTFVIHVNGESGEFSELVCKCFCFCRLWTLFAGETEGITHDYRGNSKFACEPAKRSQILTAIVLPFEGHYRLGGHSKFVRNSDTYSPIADIQTEEARGTRKLRKLAGVGVGVHDPSLKAGGGLAHRFEAASE